MDQITDQHFSLSFSQRERTNALVVSKNPKIDREKRQRWKAGL